EEVREAGVDVLDAVSLDCTDYALGDEAYAGHGIGDHFGVVALVELLQHLKSAKARVQGTLTVAFVGQSWIGGRGLERVLNEIHPDEMIYVGRFFAAKSQSNSNAQKKLPMPGQGILLGVADPSFSLSGFAAELNDYAKKHGAELHLEVGAEPRISGYAAPTPLPKRFAQLGV